jgi:hypothetical protein
MARRAAALGFRAHSGWAAVVAVAGTPRRPEILDRRRIEIADRSIPGSLQPYHAAEELPFERAKKLLKRCEAGSARLAHKAVGELVRDLTAKGYAVAGCGLLLASGRPLPPLTSVLASHALIHAADGEHFRAALVRAVNRHGLSVMRVPEREIYAAAASRFRISAGELQTKVGDAGKPLGPPWTADQKLAALIAWLALAG